MRAALNASIRLRADSENSSASSTSACSPRAISRLTCAVMRAISAARRSAAAPSYESPSRSATSTSTPVAAARSVAQRAAATCRIAALGSSSWHSDW